MRCCMCNREMKAFSVLIGTQPIGPTCAKKRGILPPKSPRRAKQSSKPQEPSTDQMELAL